MARQCASSGRLLLWLAGVFLLGSASLARAQAVATSATAEITPSTVIENSNRTRLDYYIDVTVGGSNTGFDIIDITIPTGFSSADVPPGGATFNGTTINGSILSRAPLTLDLDNTITTSGRIRLSIDVDVATGVDTTGKAFPVTLRRSNGSGTAVAGVQGNADNLAFNGNGWMVRTASATARSATSAVGEITPYAVMSGSGINRLSYFVEWTTTASSSGVDRIEITSPAGYNPPSRVVSVRFQNTAVPFTSSVVPAQITVNLETAITVSGRLQIEFEVPVPAVATAERPFPATLSRSRIGSASYVGPTTGNADGVAGNDNRDYARALGIAGIARAEMTPIEVPVNGGTVSFDYYIMIVLGSGSGMDRVEIAVPTSFGTPTAADITSVQQDGTSLSYTPRVSGQLLQVDLASRMTTNGVLRIQFNARAPSAVDSTGKKFVSTLRDRTTGLPAQAPTEAEADGNNASATFTVRTSAGAALSSTAEITPTEVALGAPAWGFAYDVKLAFDATTTGVNRIDITVPSSFKTPISVQNVTNSAGASLGFNTTGTSFPLLRVNLTTKVTAATTVRILFTAATPDQVGPGEDFRSQVDDTSTSVAPQSTAQGNADGDNNDGNKWSVRTVESTNVAPYPTKIYWVDGGTAGSIRRANLYGTAIPELLVLPVINPYGLALDAPGGWMYWTSQGLSVGSGRIQRAPMGGGTPQTLVSNLGQPTHIALDLPAGKMYWADNATAKIQRANLDGTDVETVLIGQLGSQTPWYNTSWTYRKQITLAPTRIQGTHTNFPLLISRTDPEFAAAKTNGDDFVFTASDGLTKLDYEIESYNSTTKQLIAWVRVPRLSSSEGSKLYLYYGNASATAQSNRTGVWDPSFLFVNHMKDPNDSTSRNIRGTVLGAPTAATGKIGPAMTFDGVDDGVELPASSVTGMNGLRRMTVSAWVRLDTVTAYGNIISKADAGGCSGMSVGGLQWSQDVALRVQDCGITFFGNFRWTSGGLLNQGGLHHWMLVFDGNESGNAARGRIYLDGAEAPTTSLGSLEANTVSNSAPVRLMARQVNSSLTWSRGLLDEARVSTAARSGDWAKTEYENQRDPESFHAFSPQETRAAFSVDRQGLAVDPLADRLYWVDNGSLTLHRATRSGTQIQTVRNPIGASRGLVLEPASRILYWAEPVTHKIRRISVDGGTQTDEVASPGDPWGMDVSTATNEIFWSDTASKKVRKAALGGGTAVDVLGSGVATDPRSVALGVGGAGGTKLAVQSATAEVTPNQIATLAGNTKFAYDISAVITSAQSGVDQIRIQVPSTFGMPTVDRVLSGPLGGTLASVSFADQSSGREIRVQLTSRITASAQIRVEFRADAPIRDELTGQPFFSSLDDSLTAVPRQNALEGDGDGDTGDANSWVVTSRAHDGGTPIALTVQDVSIAPGPNAANKSCDWGAGKRRDTLTSWVSSNITDPVNLQTSDNLYHQTPAPSGASKSYGLIAETRYTGDLTVPIELNFYSELSQPGTGTPAAPVYACLWNYATNRYDPLAAIWNTADEKRNFHQVSNPGEYVDAAGNITIFFMSDAPDRRVSFDVLELRAKTFQAPSALAPYRAEDGWIDVPQSDIDKCEFPARRNTIPGWAGWHLAASPEYANLRTSDQTFHEARMSRAGLNAAALYTLHFAEDPARAWTVNLDLEGGTGSFGDDKLDVCIWNYQTNRYERAGVLGSGVGGAGNLGITKFTQQLLSLPGTYLSETGEMTLLVVNPIDNRMLLMESMSVGMSTDAPVETAALDVAQDGSIDESSSIFFFANGEDVSRGDFPGPHWSAMTAPRNWNDATAQELANLQTSNDQYYQSPDSGFNHKTAHYFQFSTRYKAGVSVSRIDLTLEVGRANAIGFGSPASYAYLWNWSTSKWVAAANFNNTADATKTFSVTTNAANFVRQSDGQMVVFVVNDDSGWQRVDYINLKVTAAAPPPPTGDIRSAVAEISPNTVTLGTTGNQFNYSVRATVDFEEPGLAGVYFDQNGSATAYLTGKSYKQVDPLIQFSWPLGTPPIPALAGVNNFSIRWTGQLVSRSAGDYTFQSVNLGLDGVRMFLTVGPDTRTVIDNWGLLSLISTSQKVTLAQNTRYPITIEYHGGLSLTQLLAGLTLSWSGPGFAMEIIPTEQLISLPFGSKSGAVDRLTVTVPPEFASPKVLKDQVRVNGVVAGVTDRSTGNQTLAVDLTEPVVSTSVIQIPFTANAPTTGFKSYDFVSTVDDSKSTGAAQATTAGDGDNNPNNSNSWTVRTPFTPTTCLWKYVKKLTVQSSRVLGPLSDFPVLVSLPADADLAANALTSGDDIVLTDAAGTMLDFEIESFTKSTGALVAWVRVPALSNTANTELRMYYGYAAATPLENPTGVWKNGYEAVYHMSDYMDASSSHHDGAVFGNPVAASGATARIGSAVTFDGTGDYVELGDVEEVDAAQRLTVSAWVKRNGSAAESSLLSKYGGPSAAEIFRLSTGTSAQGVDALRATIQTVDASGATSSGTVLTAAGTLPANTYKLVTMVFDGSAAAASRLRLYVDGTQTGTLSGTVPGRLPATIQSLNIARADFSSGAGSAAFNGAIDQLEIATVARTPEWIRTAYNNQSSPSTFIAVGAQEGAGGDIFMDFVISHDGAGIHCLAEAVTVTARSCSGQPLLDFAGNITLDTQTGRGIWTKGSADAGVFADGTADDGRATYGFTPADRGQATFFLEYREGTAAFDVDAFLTNNTKIRDDDSEGLMQFMPSGFVVSDPTGASIPTTLAGTAFPIKILAFGTDPAHPQCGIIESYAGGRPLRVWMSYVDPIIAITPGEVQDPAGSSWLQAGKSEAEALAVEVPFSGGIATVNVRYPDAGRVQFNVKDVSVTEPIGGIFGATNIFVSKPASFQFLSIAGTDATGAATERAGAAGMPTGVFNVAGKPFTVRVRALNTLNQVMPSFGAEATPAVMHLTPKLTAPAGGAAGALTGNDLARDAAQPGDMVSTTVRFSEVGTIAFDWSVLQGGAPDYLGSGPITGSSTTNVGRFIPSSFDVKVPAGSPIAFQANCNAFTYLGQSFGFQSPPTLDVTALNDANLPTINYTAAGFMNLGGVTALQATSDPVLGAQTPALQPIGVIPAPTQTVTGPGVIRLVYGGSYAFQRVGRSSAGPLVPPFAPAIHLTTKIQDTDLVRPYGSSDGIFAFSGGSAIGWSPANAQILHGRLVMDNSYGSELRTRDIPVRSEFYNSGLAWEPNLQDSCTALPTSAPYSGMSLAPAGFTSIGSVKTTGGKLSQGGATVVLAAPAPVKTGQVKVLINVNALPVPAPFLEFDVDGDGDFSPSALAYFGIFQNNQQLIYMREVY